MANRDEYVEKLKAQIGLKLEYQRQLEQVKSRREEMLYQLRLLQGASAGAWEDLMRGADVAWKGMQEAFDRARTHFEKK